MECSIVINGECSDSVLKEFDHDYIIGVDGGINHLHRIGILPSIVIGDMDSVYDKAVEWVTNNNIDSIKVNSEKDETDLQLAVEFALNAGYSTINLFCFDGGRPDHYLANIMMLRKILNTGIKCIVYNTYGYYYPANKYTVLNCKIGDTISILPLSNSLVFKECTGLKYPIDKGFEMRNDTPIGISNTAVNNTVKIDINKGECLIFVYGSETI